VREDNSLGCSPISKLVCFRVDLGGLGTGRGYNQNFDFDPAFDGNEQIVDQGHQEGSLNKRGIKISRKTKGNLR